MHLNRSSLHEKLSLWNTTQGMALTKMVRWCWNSVRSKSPEYATRLAPFEVFDCLKPAPDGVIEAQNMDAQPYISAFDHIGDLTKGTYTATLYQALTVAS